MSGEPQLVRGCQAVALAQVSFQFHSCRSLTDSNRLEVRLPRTWLSLVEEIAWNYDEETVDSVMGRSLAAATRAALDSASMFAHHQPLCFEPHLFDTSDSPETIISPDLLSPIPSRDPSPRRLRPKSKSPARWEILRTINDAVQHVMNHKAPGVYGVYSVLRCSDHQR